MLKIFMEPSLKVVQTSEGGINTIVRAYHRYAKAGGFTYVDNIDEADLHAIHAGSMSQFRPDIPIVSHLHGLYWTGDSKLTESEYLVNSQVMDVVRGATTITVPSEWVAKPIRSNLRVDPYILPHGYDPSIWGVNPNKQPFAYWNKNRVGDACSPQYAEALAKEFQRYAFVSTYGTPTKNFQVVGVQSYASNFSYVQQASIYLSTAKETFGIGTLEALISGTPVLGFAEGGNLDLVRHKLDGYLAKPNDFSDLCAGFSWLLANPLSDVGSQVRHLTWEHVVQQLGKLYQTTVTQFIPPSKRKVSFVIPMYNKGDLVLETITSLQTQTQPVHEIIVVDNNSTDGMAEKIQTLDWTIPVQVISEKRKGAAHARNTGVALASGEYIVCIDADDQIDPKFVEMLRTPLDSNPTIGVTYSGLLTMSKDGKLGRISEFPPQYNFDAFLTGKNQIPTCAMFRKVLWERVGGQRNRYSPFGAGCEDAEFWFRLGLYGYTAKKAAMQGLFWYREGGTTFEPGYYEADWRSIHRWQKDKSTIPCFAVNSKDRFSNNVYADETLVSVVIPCTSAHLDYLWDALDSLDYQTIRHKLERIVIFNGVDDSFFSNPELIRLRTAFPHVVFKFFSKKGAGFARNRGAEVASGKFLVFLDADDWLEPDAVEKMLVAYKKTGAIIYGDYFGYSNVSKEEAQRLESQGRLLHLDRNNFAKIRFYAADYNPALAATQPKLQANGQFYVWSLISALLPKAYWQCVGGFDETMPSWEDWDFWIRLAKEEIPFARLPEPVLNYRFNTGNLREHGKTVFPQLLEHMEKKEIMGCCGSKRRRSEQVVAPATPLLQTQSGGVRSRSMGTTDLIKVRLVDTRTDSQLISIAGQNYGVRDVGDVFYMQVQHAKRYPQKFVPVEDVVEPLNEEVFPELDLEPEPTVMSTEDELVEPSNAVEDPSAGYAAVLTEMGVSLSPVQKKRLREAGLFTVGDFLRNRQAFDQIEGFSDPKKQEFLEAIQKTSGITL